jgi:hypothetical protein
MESEVQAQEAAVRQPDKIGLLDLELIDHLYEPLGVLGPT